MGDRFVPRRADKDFKPVNGGEEGTVDEDDVKKHPTIVKNGGGANGDAVHEEDEKAKASADPNMTTVTSLEADEPETNKDASADDEAEEKKPLKE